MDVDNMPEQRKTAFRLNNKKGHGIEKQYINCSLVKIKDLLTKSNFGKILLA